MRIGALYRGSNCVVPRVWLADRWPARLRGLLGREPLAPCAREGLLLTPCGAIHTIGMRYALDVVFLDEEGAIVGWRESVGPWRACSAAGAKRTLELGPGSIDIIRPHRGERLLWREPAIELERTIPDLGHGGARS